MLKETDQRESEEDFSKDPLEITASKSSDSKHLPSTSFDMNGDTLSTSSSDVLPLEAIFDEN